MYQILAKHFTEQNEPFTHYAVAKSPEEAMKHVADLGRIRFVTKTIKLN